MGKRVHAFSEGINSKVNVIAWLGGWLVGWVDMAYQPLTPNPFLCKQYYFKQFSLAWVYSLIVKTFLFQPIQFRQTVLIQLIPFSISTDFVYTQLDVIIVQY